MQVLKEEMKCMENCIDRLIEFADYNTMPQWLQDLVIEADKTRMEVHKRLKKNNRRMADYVAERRLTDKNYARSKKNVQ